MVRKVEFLRRSEARIIVYLSNATKLLRYGVRISEVLKIDISYTMKILRQMYNKGWIATHVYDKTTYFRLTITAPTTEAKEDYYPCFASPQQFNSSCHDYKRRYRFF